MFQNHTFKYKCTELKTMLQEILAYKKINNVKDNKILFLNYKSVQSDKCENNFFDNASLNIGFTMMINPAVRFSKKCLVKNVSKPYF
jgi:hypothetical protein